MTLPILRAALARSTTATPDSLRTRALAYLGATELYREQPDSASSAFRQLLLLDEVWEDFVGGSQCRDAVSRCLLALRRDHGDFIESPLQLRARLLERARLQVDDVLADRDLGQRGLVDLACLEAGDADDGLGALEAVFPRHDETYRLRGIGDGRRSGEGGRARERTDDPSPVRGQLMLLNPCHQSQVPHPACFSLWQVTGVRQDAYLRAHPFVAEEPKPAEEEGEEEAKG